jgi:creatinine amidohydrolase
MADGPRDGVGAGLIPERTANRAARGGPFRETGSERRRPGMNEFSDEGARPAGVFLETATWKEAEPLLRADPLMVLPVGAAAKEHGPHLPLGTDRIVADYLARRLAHRVAVIVMPTLTYGYYPHFAAVPGSTHLEAVTFGALVTDAVLSVRRHGPRRFLILNTGVSTYPVLEVVARDLERRHGLIVGVTRIEELGRSRTAGVIRQREGSHADEQETSLLLAIAPEVVRQDLAAAEFPDRTRAPAMFVPRSIGLRRDGGVAGQGVYGDPTLATVEKGRVIAEAMVDDLVSAAEALRTMRWERTE